MNLRFASLIALCCVLAAPVYGQNAGQLIALSVSQLDAGSPPFNLQVKGGNFVQGSTVLWGTRMLQTSFVDAGDLTALVTSDLLATSGGNQIIVQNPNGAVSGFAYVYVEPVLYSVTPNSVPTGSSTQSITVTGAGFDAADVVQVNPIGGGGSIPTVFVSSNTLTAVIPATTLAHSADAAVLVVEAGCCFSRPVYLQIGTPPLVGTLNPNSVAVGTTGFLLTVFGSNFVSGAVVNWNGAAIPTSYVSSSQLTAQVPASPPLTQLNPIPVYVLNPDGGTSNPANVTVVQSGPVISGLFPPSSAAGVGDFTLTVNGQGFVSASKVLWNGVGLSTTFNSATQLTAAVPAGLTATPGSAQITVQNPGVPVSSAITFSFPAPQISGIAPLSTGAGSAGFTLTVSGSGFLVTSTVLWGAVPLTTTYVNTNQLTAVVPASLLATPTAVNVMVSNSGTPSNTAPFTVGAPSLLTISPASASAGSNGFTVTAVGANFTPTTQVQWNTTLLPATVLATTNLTANVPASLLATPGTLPVSVVNPGGTASNVLTFAVNPPIVTQITPPSAPAGSSGLNLTVNGSGFATGSQVLWNATAVVTNFISVTQLYVAVAPNLLATAGTVNISVSSPGGATSNAVSFVITSGGGGLSISTLSPASASTGGLPFVLTVNGGGFPADSVVQWNGAPLNTTYVGPTQLTAAVPATLIAISGSASVTVISAAGSSNAVAFPINSASAVNAASFLPTVAPGSLISVFGSNLAAAPVADTVLPWPSKLGGVSMTINGVSAPLYYVSPGQINAQVPFETHVGTATAVITSGGVTSATLSFPVTATGPGTFVVQNYADGSLNAPNSPVAAGQYVVVYMTGQGAVDNPVATGATATSSPLSNSLAHVTATIGGQNATVLFAGLTPGLVGVLQVDLQIPALPTGPQPLIVTIGGAASNTVNISIM